jgi:hypothetical protein
MSIRNLKAIAFMLGAILFLGSFVAQYIVVNGFITHPTSAVAASSETIPYEVKGKIVYITQEQKNQVTAIYLGEIAGFSILLIYAYLARRKD